MSKTKEEILETARKWKINNSEKVKNYRKLYYLKNKEREKKTHNKWKSENVDLLKEIKKKSDREYREKNREILILKRKKDREKINLKFLERYKNDINFNIGIRLRASLNQAIRLSNGKKSNKTFNLLGIPIQDFKNYLESKFLEGMNWENRTDWHIDHIKPCAYFNLKDPDQQKECFHYTNLQPLWKRDNLSKNSIYNGEKYKHKK